MPSSLRDDPRLTPQRRVLLAEAGRYGIAVAITALIWVLVAASDGYQGTGLSVVWVSIDVVATLASFALLRLRRRHPFTVVLVILLLTGVSGGATGPAVVALGSYATHQQWVRLAALLPVWVLTGQLVVRLQGDAPENVGQSVSSAMAYVAIVALGAYTGERRRVEAALKERVLTAEREEALRVAQAKLEERSRIAREMHDVLAHRISLVAMHSGALTYRTDLTPQQVAETAEVIRSNANAALSELRSVLGVMRGAAGSSDDAAPGAGTPGGAVEPPQPTLGALRSLVSEAGSAVRLEVVGDVSLVSEASSRHAYRIVQECLTNARKHAAGEELRLKVTVSPAHGTWWAGGGARGGEVLIEARNGVPRNGGAALVPGAGVGLVGLAERAVIAGGTLTHEVDRAGDFVVRARIPWS